MKDGENSCNLCKDYWVATDGCDLASGDYANPFLTIARARDVVRNDPEKGKVQINVNIRDGVHRQDQPIIFLPEDSGSLTGEVVYRSAAGEHATISGAAKVTDWTLHDSEKGIWMAETNIHTKTLPRQLYVNGKRAIRARSIDYPNYYTPTTTGYTYQYNGGTDQQIPPTWKNPSFVEAVTVTQWKMLRCPVAQVKNESEVIMQQPCWNNCNIFPYPWNFHLLSWWENAYEFLDTPGEWYLDPTTKILYYIPREGEDMSTADVELPLLEALVLGLGNEIEAVAHIRFEQLSFEYATWLGPNTSNGYALDQSGFHVIGQNPQPTLVPHALNVVRTPGNVSFIFSQYITFEDNSFAHMGAVSLDFSTGSQNNRIVNNRFLDISAAGIQLGGVDSQDHHPDLPSQVTRDNVIASNLIEYTGQEYYDAPGIFIGFTTNTRVEQNDIFYTAWAGIAIGWGWGLLDPDGYTGQPYATPYMWGIYTTPTTAKGNKILNNNIQYFLEKIWDGGAIYCTGFQGSSMEDGLLISGNVAQNKRPRAGGITFYTDCGSRYVTLSENVSLNNPTGFVDFGPCGKSSSFTDLCFLTDIIPYGADLGGGNPYGDFLYLGNYLNTIFFFNVRSSPYAPNHPFNMTFSHNTQLLYGGKAPSILLLNAGRQ